METTIIDVEYWGILISKPGYLVGSAVNSDGRSASLTAPSGIAQEEAVGLGMKNLWTWEKFPCSFPLFLYDPNTLVGNMPLMPL